MSLKTLINSIGHFFEGLFNHAKSVWNALPKEQQDAVIQGVNISQIIKEGYKDGEHAVVAAVSQKLGVSEDIAKGVILEVGRGFGVNTGKIQDILDHIADTIGKGLSDPGYNQLWQSIAKFAATFLATGSLNWVTLSLGLIEIAFQKVFKNVH